MKASTALKKEADAADCWKGFQPGSWQTSIDVRDFIVEAVRSALAHDHFAGP